MKQQQNSDRTDFSARYLIYGGLALLAFVCGLFVWSATAQLESAAVAAGKVSVENQRKVVQHFDGGIVYAIHVQEGASVRKGVPLITLQSTAAGATHRLLEQRLAGLRVRQLRLIAETTGKPIFELPAVLENHAVRAGAGDGMKIERAIFRSRLAHLKSQSEVLANQADSARREIGTLRRQIEWSGRQHVLIVQETRDVKMLLDKGLARRPRYLALKRAAAGISARRELLQGHIERAGSRVNEASLRTDTLQTERRNTAASELRLVDDQIADVSERLVKAREQLARTVVVSPVDGAVVNLRVSTIGGVIQPGAALMDIVPRNEHLLIDAQVRPADIDIVRKGQTARIRMTVFDSRTTPVRMGRVLSVSADRLADERSGQPYYLARIELEDGGPDAAELTPGMPVEVLINGGRQTFLDYLLRPLLSSFDRSMRES